MSSVLHRTLKAPLPEIAGAEGAWLIDRAGRRYYDACGGAAVSCLGHHHPAVAAAVADQMTRFSFAHTGFFTNEAAEALADHLIARAPEGFGAGRVMFLGSGSEAMEAALKLARQSHVEAGQGGRHRFIARDMAYHGNTLMALAAGGHAARRAPYAPMLAEVGRIPACYAYRGQEAGESVAAYGLRVADALEAEILRLGPESVAGFVVEPVSGAALGTVPPVPGYFRRLREICDRHGVLMIADEVMCGMGRTGTLFALEQEGVCPDLVVIAKGLGAGFLPIAAVLARESVVAPVLAGSGTLWNGHTYMSHAVACAGALAVLRVIEAEGLVAQVATRGAAFRAALDGRFGGHAHVGDIRGRGLFQSLELVADRATKAPFPAARGLAPRIKAAALEAGLMCYPMQGCADGVRGDHVLLAPPYGITEAEQEFVLDILSGVIDGVLRGGTS